MSPARGRALARAGLLGNPSDGYHGATLSFTFADFAAEATVEESRTPEVVPPDPDGRRLVKAAVARFAAHHRRSPTPVSVDYHSTIPRQVGLGGSSAIVTATLRALSAHHGTEIPPAELASLALAVEAEDLGIAAGPQDRVAQAFEGLVFMDFEPGRGRYEPMDPALLPPLYVAYRRAGADPSGRLHADLRARHARGDRAVTEGMARLGDLARRGRHALLAGDHAELARLVDANLEERRALGAVDDASLQMAMAARALGLCANLAGSGGAIVGVCPSPARLDELTRSLDPLEVEVIAPRTAR
jgi:glucuronokinase